MHLRQGHYCWWLDIQITKTLHPHLSRSYENDSWPLSIRQCHKYLSPVIWFTSTSSCNEELLGVTQCLDLYSIWLWPNDQLLYKCWLVCCWCQLALAHSFQSSHGSCWTGDWDIWATYGKEKQYYFLFCFGVKYTSRSFYTFTIHIIICLMHSCINSMITVSLKWRLWINEW